MKYKILVTRTVRDYALVEVEAISEGAAKRQAIRDANCDGRFCDNDNPKYRTAVVGGDK